MSRQLKQTALLILACFISTANPLAAQTQPSIGASAFLPHSHWSFAAARRLHAAGLAPAGFDPSSGIVTIERMREALGYASTHAATSPLNRVAEDISWRFNAEFPEGSKLHVDANAGLRERSGELLVGSLTEEGGWDPPQPRAPLHGAAGDLDVDYSTPHVAFTSSLDADRDVVFRTLALSVTSHEWAVFGGRTQPGNLTTESGSVIANGVIPYDGGGVYRTSPLHLPGFLHSLGPVGFETTLSRAHEQSTVFEPWFWYTRVSIEPFSWMGLHATRGVYAGSLVEGRSLSASDLARLLIGQNGRTDADDYADNQIVALDGWFRSPKRSIPLMFYWDWGSDDSSGGWWETAGRVLGLRLAAVPSMPFLELGAERVAFDAPGFDHGPFYWHNQFLAGWAEERVLLGHPIGGNGRETMLYANASLLGSHLLLGARGYHGARGVWNVFMPTRTGKFSGAGMSLDYSENGMAHARAKWAREWGEGWSQTTLEIAVGISH